MYQMIYGISINLYRYEYRIEKNWLVPSPKLFRPYFLGELFWSGLFIYFGETGKVSVWVHPDFALILR